MPWEERRLQLLKLLEGEPITTATFADNANVHHSTAGRWLKRLLKEGDLMVAKPAVIGGGNPQPATFTIAANTKRKEKREER